MAFPPPLRPSTTTSARLWTSRRKGWMIPLGASQRRLIWRPAWQGGEVATELVRYELSEGGSILVEVGSDEAYGYEQCARDAGGVVIAGRTLESAFRLIVPSARAILDSVEDLKASEV